MSGEHSAAQDEAALQARGYRKTPQRLLILSILQASQTRLAFWQILERVHEQSLGVSSSTLYRSLEILEAAHLVRRILLPGEGVTYQAVRGCGEEHYLVCQRCHKTIAIALDQLPTLVRQLEAQHCFHKINAAIIASGYCDTCWPLVHQT